MDRHFKYVGQNIEKVDARKLAAGRGCFTDDVHIPGLLHAKLLFSPHAHARILAVDTTKAQLVPGVRCILTHTNINRVPYTTAGENYPEPPPYDQVLLDSKVRFVGDRVAAVAAESLASAQQAVELIRVEYEVLDAIFDPADAGRIGAPVIHDETDSVGIVDPQMNIAARLSLSVGSAEDGFAEADIVREREYRTQFVQHCALEPHITICYLDEDERLVVRTSTQVPFHVRRILAKVLQIPAGRIRVIKPRIGGGFGGKQEVVTEDICGALCLATGRPVRLEFTRSQEFFATRSRHPQTIQLKMGLKHDGKITAVDMRVLENAGAYGTHSLTVMGVTATKTISLYNVRNARFKGDAVYTNLPVAGAFRGYGAPQGFFAFESLLDELAHDLNLDPVALRLRNVIRAGEAPPFAQIIQEGRESSKELIRTCGMDQCLARGMKEIGWNEIGRKDPDNPIKRGIGLACAMQSSGIARLDMGAAFLKMNEDGSFNLLVGVPDIGTGSDTIMAQIVSEVLSVPTNRVVLCACDTDVTPFDSGAYASSTTFISGAAVKKAAEDVRNQIIQVAARILQVPAEELNCRDSNVVHTSGRVISYAEICCSALYQQEQFQIMAAASHYSRSSPPPFSAVFADVEVDTETGIVRVRKIVSAIDCGFAINPHMAEGQVEGGVAQALGFALTEQMPNDSQGWMTRTDFRTYRIFNATDMPEIKVLLITTNEPAGPFGAKSIAEIPISAPAAAIANAVHDATGVRIRELPLTPARVHSALKLAAHEHIRNHELIKNNV